MCVCLFTFDIAEDIESNVQVIPRWNHPQTAGSRKLLPRDKSRPCLHLRLILKALSKPARHAAPFLIPIQVPLIICFQKRTSRSGKIKFGSRIETNTITCSPYQPELKFLSKTHKTQTKPHIESSESNQQTPVPPPPRKKPPFKKKHQHRRQIAVLAHQHLQKQPPEERPKQNPTSIEQKCARTITLKSTPNSSPQDTQPSILRKSTSAPNRIPNHHLSCMPSLHPTVKMQPFACTVTCMPDGTRASISQQCARTVTSTSNSSPQTASHSTTPQTAFPPACKNMRAPSPPKSAPAPQTACPLAPYRES